MDNFLGTEMAQVGAESGSLKLTFDTLAQRFLLP